VRHQTPHAVSDAVETLCFELISRLTSLETAWPPSCSVGRPCSWYAIKSTITAILRDAEDVDQDQNYKSTPPINNDVGNLQIKAKFAKSSKTADAEKHVPATQKKVYRGDGEDVRGALEAKHFGQLARGRQDRLDTSNLPAQ
jgi:hypothetical protein